MNCTNLSDALNEKNPRKDYPTIQFHITLAVSIIGVISNTLLVIVTILDPLKILRKGPWATIINLAFADLLTSVGSIMFCRLTLLGVYDGMIWANFVQNTGYSASFFMLTFLTVEMYVITKYPLHRKLMLTRRNVIATYTFSWCAALLFGSIPYYTSFQYAIKLYIAWIGILELSVVILMFFKVLVILEIVENRESFRSDYRSTKYKHIAKTVIILNVILILTAFPYFISKQLEFLGRLRKIENSVLISRFPYYYLPIASLNFIVNPFVYAWRLRNYRLTLVAVFKSTNWKRNFQQGSVSVKSSAITYLRNGSS